MESSKNESIGGQELEQHHTMKKKESSSEYEGLTLNLMKTGDNNSTQEEGEAEYEEDLELLEYQRQRSTPKIEINKFEEDEDIQEFKDKEALRQKELFSQVGQNLDNSDLVL